MAAYQREAPGGPCQRLAISGCLLVTFGRGRSAVLCAQPLRTGVSRYARRWRWRAESDLEVRHDGGGRIAASQYVELVAGVLRRSALCQHLERAGREPCAHSVTASAGDHRGEQEDREAGVG